MKLKMILPQFDNNINNNLLLKWIIRNFENGDEERWSELISKSHQKNIDKKLYYDYFRSQMIEHPAFNRSSIFFVVEKDNLTNAVATASAWYDTRIDDPKSGYLHMVAVLPQFQGLGLGRLVALSALECMKTRGDTCARLHTDPWRIAAVRMYLTLGFIPEITGKNTLEEQISWSNILKVLCEYRK